MVSADEHRDVPPLAARDHHVMLALHIVGGGYFVVLPLLCQEAVAGLTLKPCVFADDHTVNTGADVWVVVHLQKSTPLHLLPGQLAEAVGDCLLKYLTPVNILVVAEVFRFCLPCLLKPELERRLPAVQPDDDGGVAAADAFAAGIQPLLFVRHLGDRHDKFCHVTLPHPFHRT